MCRRFADVVTPCYLSKRMALYDQEREVGMGNELAQKMEALKEAPLKDLKAAYAEYFPGKKYTTPPIALSATHT